MRRCEPGTQTCRRMRLVGANGPPDTRSVPESVYLLQFRVEQADSACVLGPKTNRLQPLSYKAVLQITSEAKPKPTKVSDRRPEWAAPPNFRIQLLWNSHNSRRSHQFTIAANDFGSRLAPPTSPPSISCCDINAWAFSGLTLPP
jgi:hypothetical protein